MDQEKIDEHAFQTMAKDLPWGLLTLAIGAVCVFAVVRLFI